MTYHRAHSDVPPSSHGLALHSAQDAGYEGGGLSNRFPPVSCRPRLQPSQPGDYSANYASAGGATAGLQRSGAYVTSVGEVPLTSHRYPPSLGSGSYGGGGVTAQHDMQV